LDDGHDTANNIAALQIVLARKSLRHTGPGHSSPCARRVPSARSAGGARSSRNRSRSGCAPPSARGCSRRLIGVADCLAHWPGRLLVILDQDDRAMDAAIRRARRPSFIDPGEIRLTEVAADLVHPHASVPKVHVVDPRRREVQPLSLELLRHLVGAQVCVVEDEVVLERLGQVARAFRRDRIARWRSVAAMASIVRGRCSAPPGGC